MLLLLLSQAQAKFLPKQFYKCKKPKPSADVDASGAEPLSIGCVAMSKKACEGESGCVWCNSSMWPAKCYEEVRTHPTAVMHAVVWV